MGSLFCFIFLPPIIIHLPPADCWRSSSDVDPQQAGVLWALGPPSEPGTLQIQSLVGLLLGGAIGEQGPRPMQRRSEGQP